MVNSGAHWKRSDIHQELRKRPYDLVIDFHGLFKVPSLFFLAREKKTWHNFLAGFSGYS